MELIRGLHNVTIAQRGCVLTIGNFDGLHLGHQALIARARALTEQHSLPLALLTFEPTAREFFARDARPGRISTFRGKVLALRDAGLQHLIVQRFGRGFCALAAQEFLALLVQRLGVRAVVVGEDFHFGAKAAGDVALLREHGRQHGYEVSAVSAVMVDGARCSSTALRSALAQPDLARAARLLGRPYTLTGRVRQGLQLGRTLGMPTANIALHRRPALRMGIYAVRARCGERTWSGVASLGVRPTLGLTRRLLETHVFSDLGEAQLYGETLTVEPVQHLRDEVRFDTLDALAAQMQRDKRRAMDLLGLEPS